MKAKLATKCLIAIDQAREEIDQAIKVSSAVISQGNNTGISIPYFQEALLLINQARLYIQKFCDVLSTKDLDVRSDLAFISEDSDVEFVKSELNHRGDFFNVFWIDLKDGKLGEVWGATKNLGIAWEKAIRIQ